VRIAVWHEALLLQITGDFGERSEWDEGSGTCRTAREAVSERSRGDASDIDGQNREVEMGGSTRVNVGNGASCNWASAAWGSSMIWNSFAARALSILPSSLYLLCCSSHPLHSAAMLQSLLLLRFRRLSCSPNDSTPQPPNVSTSCVSL